MKKLYKACVRLCLEVHAVRQIFQNWKSAENGYSANHGKDHSAFMGFAPMNNPKIAIAVYVENGGWGATYGVPIGKLMIEKYLTGKLTAEDEALATDIQNRRIDYGLQER